MISSSRSESSSTFVRSKPLYLVFRTKKNHYLYDTATNQILKINEDLASFLERADFTDDHLRALRSGNADGVLAPRLGKKLRSRYSIQDINREIQQNCSQVILEVTQNCNLRCCYCVYSGQYKGRRSYSSREMAAETAFAAIDYLNTHSGENQLVFVGFYGGEPLLNQELIFKATEYAKQNIKNKQVEFTLTTNGTLLTERIMQFLVDNRFHTYVSIDGPKEIHNQNRTFADGKRGSYEIVYSKIVEFMRLFPDYTNSFLHFSMVIPPGTDLVLVAEWLNHFKISSVNIATISEYDTRYEEEYLSNPIIGESELLRAFAEAGETGELDATLHLPKFFVQRALYSSQLFRILNRRYPVSSKDFTLDLGICVPGSRKLFVDCNGDFYPCEKTDGNSHLRIGNIINGVDIEKAFGIVKSFYSFMSPNCTLCWLQRVCPACFVEPTLGNEYNLEKQKKGCERLRKNAEKMFQVYCSILEENPDGLDFYRDYKKW